MYQRKKAKAPVAPTGPTRVALSVPGKPRLTGTFPPGTTLLDIIKTFISDGQLDGAVLSQGPSIMYLRKSIEGAESLSQTTLKGLLGAEGGSALLNLSLKGAPAPPPAPAAVNPEEARAAREQALLAAEGRQQQQQGGGAPPPSRARPTAAPAPVPAPAPAPAPAATPAPAPAPAAAIPMQTEGTPEETAGAPLGGIEGCRQAIETIRSSCFDAAASPVILTLMKYTHNLLHSPPGDDRPRNIRISNATFQAKVAAVEGGQAFFHALGFVQESRGMSYDVARDPLGTSFLVLKPEAEDRAIVEQALALLHIEADILGIGQDQRPKQKKAAAPAPPPVAFDPYKSNVTSMAPTITSEYREPSITEKKLKQLKDRQGLLEGGIPDRQVQIFNSANPPPAATPGPVLGDARSAGASDSTLIARSMHKKMEEQKKREAAPFRTRAMRELEALEKAKVFAFTVIRVQFPDRVVIQAHFHPRESVGTVIDLVRQNLSPDHANRPFHLYVSPPKTKLAAEDLLTAQGLVPAALVYLSWESTPPEGPEGGYLKPGVGAEIQAPVAYPKSTPLVESKDDSQSNGKSIPALPGNMPGQNKSSTKKGGKPSWLKL